MVIFLPMSPDIKPGSWSDGSQNEDFAEQFRQEIEQSRIQKDDLINQSLASGKIAPEMAILLRDITTSTAGNHEYGNLRKIKFVLAFREEFSKLGDKQVAYIGAGIDWQFPVALGATNIDMEDISYPEIVNNMVDTIRKFDPDPLIEKDAEVVKSIKFNIDLGQGNRKIRLNTIHGEADSYSPLVPLAGVIEAFGPSKSNDRTSPILPNVAQALQQGSLILNLDFDRARLRDGSGLEDLGIDEMAFYRVIDPKSLWGISQLSKESATNVSLEAIRKAAELTRGEEPSGYWLNEIINPSILAAVKTYPGYESHTDEWTILDLLLNRKIEHGEKMDPKYRERLGNLIVAFRILAIPNLNPEEQAFLQGLAENSSINWNSISVTIDQELRSDINWVWNTFSLNMPPGGNLSIAE